MLAHVPLGAFAIDGDDNDDDWTPDHSSNTDTGIASYMLMKAGMRDVWAVDRDCPSWP